MYNLLYIAYSIGYVISATLATVYAEQGETKKAQRYLRHALFSGGMLLVLISIGAKTFLIAMMGNVFLLYCMRDLVTRFKNY